MKRLLLVFLVASCGGDDAQGTADASVDGPGSASADAMVDAPNMGGMLALTSPVLTEGAMIMSVNTCDGANTSPQLDWTGNNMNAMAFAVVLTDKTFNNFVHSIIYDIPATRTGLPAAVEKVYAPTNVAGAHQTIGLQNTRGYAGPCPPVGDGPHTYEFAVYGVDVATLPGTSMASTKAQVLPIIMQHQTAVAKLTGTYMR